MNKINLDAKFIILAAIVLIACQNYTDSPKRVPIASTNELPKTLDDTLAYYRKKHKYGSIEEANKAHPDSVYYLRTYKFSDGILRFKNLRMLELTDGYTSMEQGYIREIPEQIKQLKNLISLECYNNNLTRFPEVVLELKQLKNLALSFNDEVNIDNIVDKIGELEDVEELSLYDCNLISFPVGITRLKQLRQLELGANPLRKFPKQIANLRELKVLNLEECNLTTIPVEISTLPNLERLHLGYNDLTAIPGEIGELVNLKELDIRNNKNLKQLPIELGNLRKLEILHISNSKVSMSTTLAELLNKNCPKLAIIVANAYKAQEFPDVIRHRVGYMTD